jgi:hypothetical protein
MTLRGYDYAHSNPAALTVRICLRDVDRVYGAWCFPWLKLNREMKRLQAPRGQLELDLVPTAEWILVQSEQFLDKLLRFTDESGQPAMPA